MMELLPVYMRIEPSTDRYATFGVHKDVVAYEDAARTKPKGRWPWHTTKPRKGCKTVTLNCYRWRAVWE